ncbi:MAG: hypothetical protein ACO2PN_24865 [Pyrobaculum sp.]|jgi:hypothetical protein
MNSTKAKLLIPLLLAMLVFAVTPEPLAVVEGARPTNYVGCYPNACVGQLHPTHWPFGGTPPTALVASGSPAYGDYYNTTLFFQYLGLTPMRGLFPRNASNAIRIGFTQFGEFVATLSDGTAGGISMAFYNRPEMFARYEMWVTNNIPYIPPADWLNGWTLSGNLSAPGGDRFVMFHMYAVYSNRTHAGGGRGLVLYYNATGTPTRWPAASRWRWFPIQAAPLEVVYDSPRLLIARGSSYFVGDLGDMTGDSYYSGYKLTAYVNYTLVFPKAFPYAIIYYNYTIDVYVATKLGAGVRFQSASFTIRFELDQLNARDTAATLRVTVFERTFGGQDGHLLHATPKPLPRSPYNNVTFFALVWPRVTEINVTAIDYIPVYTLNNYKILLPTGSDRLDAQDVIPFVIFQQKDTLNIVRGIGERATYRGGRMFVYGLTKNNTDWALGATPTHDDFIERLIRYTLFEINGGTLPNRVFKVVPSRGHIADVLGSGFIGGIPVLDVAPLAYGTVDPLTMAGFVGLPNYGGVPATLARMTATSPWFVDAYSRPGLLPYLLINRTFYRTIYDLWARVAGGWLVTVGGPAPNLLTRYAQDMAWWSTFVSAYTGDFFNPAGTYRVSALRAGRPILTAWNGLFQPEVTTTWPPAPNQIGYGIISISVDPNGTKIIQFWGANAQDTYWLTWAFAFGELGGLSFATPGTYLVQIYYGNVTLPRAPGPPNFDPSPAAFKVYFTAPYQYYTEN